MKRRSLAAACFFFLFCACLAACSSHPPGPPASEPIAFGIAAEPEPSDPLPDLSGRYGRGFLSPEGVRVYDDFYRLALAVDPGRELELPTDFTEEEADTLLGYFIDDNPEFYWLEPYYLVSAAQGVHAISYRIAPHLDAEELRRREEELAAASEALLRGLTGSEAEQVILLHDRLIDHMAYNRYTEQEDIGTIYGGLVKRSGVCDAYAKSFQYLARQAGMECVYLRGTTDRGIPHSWNAVQIEGEWHHLDPTWDERKPPRHDYLLIDSEEMGREHFWDTGQYPTPPHSDGGMDYYRLGGYAIRPGGADEVLEQLAAAYAKQLAGRATGENPVYLEVKVLGDAGQYQQVKDIFFGNVFEVIRRMEAYLPPEIRLAPMNSVECNFNDAMRVITFFPSVSTDG